MVLHYAVPLLLFAGTVSTPRAELSQDFPLLIALCVAIVGLYGAVLLLWGVSSNGTENWNERRFAPMAGNLISPDTEWPLYWFLLVCRGIRAAHCRESRGQYLENHHVESL
jgi:hypothetical protein